MSRSPMQASMLILIATLGAFVVRGVGYAWIESWLPAIVALVGVCMIWLGATLGPRWQRAAVRTWAAWLVLYGLVRVALGVSVKLAGVDSTHAIEHTGLLFYTASALYFLAGVLLWRSPLPSVVLRN